MSDGDGAAESTEVEWQFDALDLRPVERWLAALPSRAHGDAVPTLTVLAKPTRRLVDRYMDTADWRMAQAGFVLRTRQRGRAVEITMKDTGPADKSGLRRRLELTESLPSGLASLGAGGPVGRRVHAVAGRRPLVQVLEVRTRRQPFSLRAAGTEVAEVAIDDTTILVGPNQPPARLRRVEVEVAPDWVGLLSPVVDDLRASAGLSPATLSKFEAGILAAGASVPGPPDLGATEFGPDATLGEVAYAVVRRQLREIISHEPGTRLGEDVEELHDMRVATRRLRAAIDLFAGALPARAAALRDELRWIADELGAVRDLDVQLERMVEMTGWSQSWAGSEHGATLTHLRALLTAERDDARRRLLDALDSARWERLTTALVALARQGPNRRVPGARVPAAIAVPPLVAERHRAVTKAARRARRSDEPSDYHRLRIRAKRLRYSLEFTSALYGPPATRFIKKLSGLQDSLGTMQDAEVAAARLFSLATETPPAGVVLPEATVFVMGGIAERYRQESEELRSIMGRKLRILERTAWQRLAASIERSRRHAEDVVAAGLTLRSVLRGVARTGNGASATAAGTGAGAGPDAPAPVVGPDAAVVVAGPDVAGAGPDVAGAAPGAVSVPDIDAPAWHDPVRATAIDARPEIPTSRNGDAGDAPQDLQGTDGDGAAVAPADAPMGDLQAENDAS